eukprot:CAMPEP_0167770358 /NCGR_PEP_ID=MMETSP0110_2-20121227/17884_1 /TAXON_ID=629695 /ORGANISM="Gymnochlora sp., Strain CCMP2014" /LENGTH=169 /DNA_ID=CAMNT_0007659545 /DNA_START=138 /DNA_END=644 /DNA_ORIENTATION=-
MRSRFPLSSDTNERIPKSTPWWDFGKRVEDTVRPYVYTGMAVFFANQFRGYMIRRRETWVKARSTQLANIDTAFNFATEKLEIPFQPEVPIDRIYGKENAVKATQDYLNSTVPVGYLICSAPKVVGKSTIIQKEIEERKGVLLVSIDKRESDVHEQIARVLKNKGTNEW